MRQIIRGIAWSATIAVPSAASAQMTFWVGYGTATAAAVIRVVRGVGDAAVDPGARIRIRTANTLLEGRVASITRDSVVVETPGGTRVFGNASFDDLQVSVGERSRWAEGFLMGLGVGALGGFALGYGSGDDHDGGYVQLTAEAKAVIGGAVFGVLGSGIGAVAGAAITREAWARAKRPLGNRSVAVVPVVGRQNGLALRLTF